MVAQTTRCAPPGCSSDASLLHDAESRLYYAIYHAAVAVLLTEGVEPRSHAGTASMLGLHFVKTGRMGPEDARLFARIQKYTASRPTTAAISC